MCFEPKMNSFCVHDAVLGKAIVSKSGYRFKDGGDRLCVGEMCDILKLSNEGYE